MGKIKKNLFMLGMIFLILSLYSTYSVYGLSVGSENQAIDVYERNSVIDLKIPFEINGSTASGAATCNITIQYPNSTYLKSKTNMTNLNNGEFNVTLNSSETLELGIHKWVMFCCDTGSDCAVGYGNFEIVFVRSKDVSSGEAIFYIPIFIFILSLFFLSLYGAIAIPWENRRNSDGTIIDINSLKYVKLFLFFLSYLILLFIFTIGKGVSENFLRLDVAIAFFNIGFTFLLVALGPILICTVGLLIIHYLADKKIQRALARGLSPK